MTRAYNECYLNDAMRNLGEAFNYAVNCCQMDPDEFMALFLTGSTADLFGYGVPQFVCGMSGTELAIRVIGQSGLHRNFPEPADTYERSPEYWGGWVLAYYQWFTGRSFRDIMKFISMKELIGMYHPLHEAGEDKFVETINAVIERTHPSTKLQTLRRAAGYSQKSLSAKSGVSLRMIQQYEQRAKDINKASATHLAALARALGCNMENLMECY
ncbi:MAG: helix-turn-helix domain-containing protein [Lachnospiraceae bacterium]|nr:helix-turn-helix domain-containing protein [Lachnospiraceae bacterium]